MRFSCTGTDTNSHWRRHSSRLRCVQGFGFESSVLLPRSNSYLGFSRKYIIPKTFISRKEKTNMKQYNGREGVELALKILQHEF
jgi:hypothetical protein